MKGLVGGPLLVGAWGPAPPPLNPALVLLLYGLFIFQHAHL